MPANFFLLNHSFRYQEGITIPILEDKVFSLSNDYSFIKKNNETISVHDSIYDEEIYPGLPLWRFLYDATVKTELSRDVKRYLSIIIEHSSKTNLDIDKILQLLDSHNEENVYGLVCLHQVDNINRKYLVYSKNDWFEFHRHFLGLYPISEAHFHKECKKYFLQLFLHKRIIGSLGTIEGGFRNFAKKIVACLSALNDRFPKL